MSDSLPRDGRMISGRIAMLVAVTASVLVVAAFWDRSGYTALLLLTPVCLSVALAAVLLVAASSRSDLAPAGIGTLCIAAIGLFGITVPAQQLVTGQRVSILAYLGVFSPGVIDDAPRAGLVFLLCLCAFALVELLPLQLPGKDPSPTAKAWESEPLYWALLVVGLASTVVFGSTVSTDSLDERGQTSGDGISAVLQQCLLLSIALGVGNRHWGRKVPAAASLAALAFSLAFTGSRSGLLFVVVALGVRWLHRIRRQGLGPGVVLGFSGLAYGAAVFIVGFAQWRTAYRQQGSASLGQYLLDASADPIGRLSSQGALDTFDGLILSLNVDRTVVGATVLDPLRSVLNLVPSQLWPDKPGYLAPEVTHYYTLFGGQAGIFLSGPGYAYIVTGGVIGACIFFGVLGLLFRYLTSRFWHSPVIMTIILYSLLRFIIGGDSFDFQYGFTLVLSLAVGRLAVMAVTLVLSAITHGEAPSPGPAPAGGAPETSVGAGAPGG